LCKLAPVTPILSLDGDCLPLLSISHLHSEEYIDMILLRFALTISLTALLTTTTQAQGTDLKVSENGRFLVKKSDNRPFFYLGDTAWELFHRLNRTEAVTYLDNRAQKGFTVIQAVALGELEGLTVPNAHGDRPLTNNNPATPAVTEGTDPANQSQYDYWDHCDYIIKEAEARGLYIGLLPTWGRYVVDEKVFDPSKAESYGKFLGSRYRTQKNIIWILGGDRRADGVENVWRAMAKGIAIGISGSEDYSLPLMTYHPNRPNHSSQWFHNEKWLDFNMFQSGHRVRNNPNYEKISSDYAKSPTKPVLDGEPAYEDHPVRDESGYFRDHDVRKVAYWALFAGAFGHTYGHHSIWQFYAQGRRGITSPDRFWTEAINRPGAQHMKHVRSLMESRPFLSRIPDQSILASSAGSGGNHLRATRSSDGSYAFIYVPTNITFSVNLSKIGGSIKAWWFNPRTGEATDGGSFANTGNRSFTPPETSGPDWVLVLDDSSKGFNAPGSALNPTPARSFSINLVEGWNLISLPIQPLNTDIQVLIQNIAGSVSAIYSYNGDYLSFFPGNSSNSLTSMAAGKGYWIYMNSRATLTFNGTDPPETIALQTGWNLTGYNSTQPMETAQALQSISQQFVAMYGFDPSSNSYNSYGAGTDNSLTTLQPGRGYWIYTDAATWTLP
jgi:hypothetical protein